MQLTPFTPLLAGGWGWETVGALVLQLGMHAALKRHDWSSRARKHF